MQNQDSPMYHIFLEQCRSNNLNSWALRVKSLLDELGYSDIWSNFDRNFNYLPLFKQRLRDQYIQNWSMSLKSLSKLDQYCKYKTQFHFEKYIDAIKNDVLRKQLSCFRLCSHKLEIEVGRYSGIARAQRICKVCLCNQVESEYHFLLCCPVYSDLRRQCFGTISWPNIHTFINILSSNNSRTILKTAKYLRDAFKLRTEKIQIASVT